MIYELWDEVSSNQLGAYRTEAEALALARELIVANPPDHGRTLALLGEDARGRVQVLAAGGELVARALAMPSHDQSRRATA